jgi:hypothetical protein
LWVISVPLGTLTVPSRKVIGIMHTVYRVSSRLSGC